MTKKLIIVESPAKIKTLRKFLGSDYLFESSIGHIRDLPKKGFGIAVEEDFEPMYQVLEEKKEVIDKLTNASKKVDMVYLAPDPDREGEAIAWHIAAILPKGTKYQRITFNALTKNAVVEALKHPRKIDQALVDAQQARRLLDRIVGYKISPILTKRVQGTRDGGLSAGRVQSVALKLVVDREKEIEVFVPIEYWNMGAMLSEKNQESPFHTSLYSVDGLRVDKIPSPNKEVFTISSKEEADRIRDRLQKARYTVGSIERKEKRRNPVPPFITSTLQQESYRHFGFSPARTMNIAQGLYEGVDLGSSGTEGLITYMRTDSVRLEPEAVSNAIQWIQKEFGKEYLAEEPRQFQSKKSAQDAHEAIRPTNLNNAPDKIRSHLSEDQFKLYSLIWKRFIATQMAPAIYDTITCDVDTDQGLVLRATGSIVKFMGFLALYEERNDLEQQAEEHRHLPNLTVGQPLNLVEVLAEQAFTRPPPRYTEASLVKELERLGIGRPSTYASIMNKIQSRDYTIKERGTLKPTELGRVIAKMLEDNFKMIMDIGFTAAMEDELEHVASNEKNWKELVREFWHFFIPSVEIAEKEAFVPKELTDYICPKSGHKLQKIWSKRKYFYGCSDYPNCDYTISIEALNFRKEEYAPNFDWDQNCPKCSAKTLLRFGRFGPFLGCTRYPECKGIINIPKLGDPLPEDMPECPALGCDGKMLPRRSRFGKIFYSCSNFPDCDVMISRLEQLREKYMRHRKTPYKKTKSRTKSATKSRSKSKKRQGSKRGSGLMQQKLKLSPELQAVVKESHLSRPHVVKKLWEYIKKHKLQDTKNRRMINPDEKLGKVLGHKKIDMLQMAKAISKHVS